MHLSPAIPILTLLVLLALPSSGLASGGFIVNTLGNRKVSMQTVYGAPDDLTALYHNPAGLGDQKGTRALLFIGPAFLGNETRLQALDSARFPEVNPAGCEAKGTCPWPIEGGYYKANFEPERYVAVVPYLGIGTDLGFLSERTRDVTVSLAVFAPGAYGASMPKEGPSTYFITDGLFLVTTLTAGAGWRITDWISVGASLSYNYMHLGFAQRFSLADVLTEEGQQPDGLAMIGQMAIGDLDFDFTGTDHGLGWGVGVLVRPHRWISIGLSYAGATSARLEGDVSFISTGSRLPPGSPARSQEELAEVVQKVGYKLPHSLLVEIYIPPVFRTGLNLAPLSWLELGVDFTLMAYSLSKKETLRPYYDPDQPGEEPLSEEGLSKVTDYDNAWELAFGVLVRPLSSWPSLEVMAGFAYYRSPVPDEYFTIDNPSMHQRIITVGARAMVTDRLRLGLAYLVALYEERDVTTSKSSPPTNVRISGHLHLPTIEAAYVF
jgi:long-subunit fatty acid transport protein